MIDTHETYSEPLYLDKENKNYIYINDCQNLKQYQIDGLRFLYRQFKKVSNVPRETYGLKCSNFNENISCRENLVL